MSADDLDKRELERFEKFVQQRHDPDNNSGRGDESILPGELRGLNWGGLLLNVIWAVGMRLPYWYPLLFLVPFVGMIMPFVLWIKGNELAWRYKRWDSKEHFIRVQERWALAGLVLTVVFIVLVILLLSWVGSLFKGILSGVPHNAV